MWAILISVSLANAELAIAAQSALVSSAARIS
jgi:hypothetical protein